MQKEVSAIFSTSYILVRYSFAMSPHGFLLSIGIIKFILKLFLKIMHLKYIGISRGKTLFIISQLIQW